MNNPHTSPTLSASSRSHSALGISLLSPGRSCILECVQTSWVIPNWYTKCQICDVGDAPACWLWLLEVFVQLHWVGSISLTVSVTLKLPSFLVVRLSSSYNSKFTVVVSLSKYKFFVALIISFCIGRTTAVSVLISISSSINYWKVIFCNNIIGLCVNISLILDTMYIMCDTVAWAVMHDYTYDLYQYLGAQEL